MARDERNPLVRVQLYRLLGGVARRGAGPARARPRADRRARRDQCEPDHRRGRRRASRPRLRFRARATASGSRRWSMPRRARASSPGLGRGSADPAMIDKLTDYAERHMTPQSRAPADRAIASIRDRLRVREQRLPDITPLAGGAARARPRRARCSGRARRPWRRRRATPATTAIVAKSVADQRERRAAAGRRDDAGEGDVEQAVADDQAGREQHAHALGEFGIGAARRRGGRRAGRAPSRSPPAASPPSADRCRCRPRAAAGAAASPCRSSVVEHDRGHADRGADADHLPVEVAAEHAVGERGDQRRPAAPAARSARRPGAPAKP